MSKKKVLKIALIILAVLAVILFAASSYIHRQVDNLVKAKISEALGEGYKADYRKSNIGLLNKTITLNQLDVSKQNDTLEFWNGQISEFTVYGFDVFKFLGGDGIGIDSISIENPKFHLLAFDNDSTNTKVETDSAETKPDKEVAISVIRLSGGKFELDLDGPEYLGFDFHLKLNDLSLSEIKEQQLSLLDHVDLAIESFHYQFPDSIYVINIEDISTGGDSSMLQLTNIDVHSNLSGTDYPKHFGWQKVNFDINIPSLSISRPTSIGKDSLIIPNIIIDGLQANLSKNKNWPLPNRHTELPQNAMAKMGLKWRCDSIVIKNGHLQFESIQTTGDVAQVELSHIEGTILEAQNIDSLLPAFTLIAGATLQKEASVNLKTVYSYGALDPFTLEGNLGNTRLEFMDDFLMKMVGIKIKAGRLEELNFDMYGNTYGVNGFVDFYYDNLEIHAIDKETGEDKKMVNFISNLVGGLVFWHENPAKDQFRRGQFSVERDVRKGFISQWMDGLLNGIMNTVSKVDPGKVKQTSENIKDKFTKNK